MTIPAKLRNTIFWQCGELGLDEEGRRDAMEAAVGKRSMKECTTDQLLKVIEHFVERGARPSRSTGKGGRRGRRPVKGVAPIRIERMITWGQRETIIKWRRWKNLSDAYMCGLSRRICGRDFPQTTRQATALIVALSSNRVHSQERAKEQSL